MFEIGPIGVVVAFVTFEIAAQSLISWWLAPRRARQMILDDLVSAGLLVVDDDGNLQRAPVVVDIDAIRTVVSEEIQQLEIQVPPLDLSPIVAAVDQVVAARVAEALAPRAGNNGTVLDVEQAAAMGRASGEARADAAMKKLIGETAVLSRWGPAVLQGLQLMLPTKQYNGLMALGDAALPLLEPLVSKLPQVAAATSSNGGNGRGGHLMGAQR